MPEFFYDYPESTPLRNALRSSKGSRVFFELMAGADSRLSVSSAADPHQVRTLASKVSFRLPSALREFWSYSAAVKMSSDCIVYSPEESLEWLDLLKRYEYPNAEDYLCVGETGDGDMFAYSIKGGEEVFLLSHETDEIEPCGDLWCYAADHVSWRIRHMRR